MSETSQSILVITDLLLGAVHADGSKSGEEIHVVRDLLKELLDQRDLPESIEKRIELFEPGDFSLAECAATFASAEPERKRRLLELVAAVRDADEEVDVAEDEYLVSLAKALGMKEAEYSDLTLDYEIEDLREHLSTLRSVKPPPLKA
ncbi:TerB family tellurite resistance protein [Sandaracinus amylolyticus]|uniref:Co-chaperone DjlA N-terminal domain-containing protein n=1 Tax=Sandaracinus amylolyticus TaxID=927083 RepID=A0A0F6SH81_9BACT|nr:TerB family tellurite resistance protein [Sandaracinus amylolyticus]AKF09984.1 hypothetical protein DB32_007133 [Sandaracinus amylolyticus]